MESVLFCSSCCNRMSQTGWLLNNRNSFLTGLEAGKSRIKSLADSVSAESTLSCSWAAGFSLRPHMVGAAGELSGVSLTRASIPFLRASPSGPNHLPKAPPPYTIIGLQHGDVGGDIKRRM